jgi:hypothetical protein
MASPTQISELHKLLVSATERRKRATKALAPKHKGGEKEEFFAACEAVLQAERALAEARSESYAELIDFPVKWDTGAPLPFLIQNDYRAFLIFFLEKIDPNWDGTYVNIRNPGSQDPSSIAVVEFKGCVSAKMGSPNDEVLTGHPLNGKGLQGYRPLCVRNSSWIKELESINSVHTNYRPERWRGLQHFLFGFHDSTFECVATSFVIEVHEVSFDQVLSNVCKKFLQ